MHREDGERANAPPQGSAFLAHNFVSGAAKDARDAILLGRIGIELRDQSRAQNKPRFVQLFEPLAPSTRATWGAGKQRAIVGGDGRRTRSSTTEEPSPGAPLGDVWDIGIIAPVAKERTGYPTQKPEALLERLILACTHPGEQSAKAVLQIKKRAEMGRRGYRSAEPASSAPAATPGLPSSG